MLSPPASVLSNWELSSSCWFKRPFSLFFSSLTLSSSCSTSFSRRSREALSIYNVSILSLWRASYWSFCDIRDSYLLAFAGPAGTGWGLMSERSPSRSGISNWLGSSKRGGERDLDFVLRAEVSLCSGEVILYSLVPPRFESLTGSSTGLLSRDPDAFLRGLPWRCCSGLPG